MNQGSSKKLMRETAPSFSRAQRRISQQESKQGGNLTSNLTSSVMQTSSATSLEFASSVGTTYHKQSNQIRQFTKHLPKVSETFTEKQLQQPFQAIKKSNTVVQGVGFLSFYPGDGTNKNTTNGKRISQYSDSNNGNIITKQLTSQSLNSNNTANNNPNAAFISIHPLQTPQSLNHHKAINELGQNIQAISGFSNFSGVMAAQQTAMNNTLNGQSFTSININNNPSAFNRTLNNGNAVSNTNLSSMSQVGATSPLIIKKLHSLNGQLMNLTREDIPQQQIRSPKVVNFPEPPEKDTNITPTQQLITYAAKLRNQTSSQLQLEADQNRLDLMMEKGMSFERNNQIVKLQQENSLQKIEIQRLEKEIENSRNEKKKNNNVNTYETTKNQVNECDKCKQIENAAAAQKATEIKQLKLQHLEKIKILEDANKNLEDSFRELQLRHDGILQENLLLKHSQGAASESQERDRQTLENRIKRHTEERIRAEKDHVEQNRQYKLLLERINLLKNSELWTNQSSVSKNEFTVVRSETIETIERQSWERSLELIDIKNKYEKLSKDYEEKVLKAQNIEAYAVRLTEELEWIKKNGNQLAKVQGSFNYMGLAEELLKLKEIIDSQINNLKENGRSSEAENENSNVYQSNRQTLLNELAQSTEQLNQLNTHFSKIINKIAAQEENYKDTIQSIPILKQFDEIQQKVEESLKCANCSEILTEAITCVPCGHNFCKACHYQRTKELSTKEAQEAAVSCLKCGPSTMIYLNESLDELIEMYNVMKSAKEIMKVYLKQL